MKYSVVVPTLNEEGNIGGLVKELKKDPNCFEVVVADNGSTDKTVFEAGEARGNVYQEGGTNASVSDAIKRGILNCKTEFVIVMDADWSHPPNLVPKLAEKLKYHDIVYGYRDKSKDSFINRFISSFGKLASLPLGPGIKDRMTGFFGIRKVKAMGVNINSGPKPFLEYVIRTEPSSMSGLPYTFVERSVGESKLGRGSILFTGIMQLVRLTFMKYTRLVKYCVVGGGGVLIYLSFTIGVQELTPYPYYIGALIGAGTAFIWNFILHGLWTFAENKHLSFRSLPNALWNLGHDNDEGDFDWWEWTSGVPHKRFKRILGKHIYELAKGDSLQNSGGNILSLGCGSSPILNMFDSESNKDSLKKVGVELNPAKLDFFKHHVDTENTTLLNADITELEYQNLYEATGIDTYDLVLCNEVVEHFDNENLSHVLRLMFESVKHGGKVIISTPDTSSKAGNLVETVLHGEFHVGMLDAKSLISKVEEAGLHYKTSRNFLWDRIHLFEKVVV